VWSGNLLLYNKWQRHKNNNYACTFYDYGVKTTIVPPNQNKKKGKNEQGQRTGDIYEPCVGGALRNKLLKQQGQEPRYKRKTTTRTTQC